ncbi:hypothetical protein [Rhizobium sp.]|jgi:hypothetical protein|uniref:hypothetical protein n=1 Tax=Rhizobium sp. TaxID=391 RepID=UPI000E985685|nr:hypothetical protein [Rhizobium sp.]
MMSQTRTTTRPRSKAALALLAVSLLASCSTTKTPPPIVDQGPIGDVDAPQVVTPKTKDGGYRDPLVSTGRKKTTAAATVPTSPTAPTQMASADTIAAPAAAPATAQGGLYAAHAQPTADQANTNSIVPSGMPSRTIQATVTSVFSTQKPLEPQAQPVAPAPVAAATQQTRPPTKAEILAGLAPDPNKRPQGRRVIPPTMPGQMPPAMAAQINPAVAAQLQGSIPTASPAAADSSAATQMEQIQGAPEAQGMTRDSFIKKFLSKLRK